MSTTKAAHFKAFELEMTACLEALVALRLLRFDK
jgi:hypothetical protein